MLSRQERAKVSLPAIYQVGSALGEGLVGNLSRDGLFLQGSLLPKEGEHVAIKFTTPNGREITVEGTTRWTTHADADDDTVPLGFGVELSSYGNDYRVVVEDYLSTQDPSTRAMDVSGKPSSGRADLPVQRRDAPRFEARIPVGYSGGRLEGQGIISNLSYSGAALSEITTPVPN